MLENKKKFIYKIFPYLIALLIFFFLTKAFFENWQKVKEYTFSFNYFYLIISYLFLWMSMFWGAYIWNKMLKILEPTKKLSYFKAFKICIYSCFGRYLPGKVWMFAGRVYLGQKQGLSKKPLVMSVVYEIILSIVAGFLLALFLLSVALDSKLYDLYTIPILIIMAGLIFSHPKFLYLLFNLALRKFKKIEIQTSDLLNYWRVIQIILYYFVVYILGGIGLFFLINSIVSLPFYAMIGVICFYSLALVSGAVALFAPDGLGVREGILVLTLQFYFPIGIAVLISVIARIWFSLAEVVPWASCYIYDNFFKKKI